MRLGVLIALLVLSFAARAAVSCGDHLAKEGATRYDIINLCGEPDWRDGWNYAEGRGVLGSFELYNSVFVEQWYYNRGPDRFIRLFTFHNLRLVRIDHLGYGWVPRRRRQCKPDMFLAGLSKYEVWFHCGDPAWAESWGAAWWARGYWTSESRPIWRTASSRWSPRTCGEVLSSP